MNWKQDLINAQVEVNRAVFEMNKPGIPGIHRQKIDPEYVVEHVRSAIEDLKNVLTQIPLPGEYTKRFADNNNLKFKVL